MKKSWCCSLLSAFLAAAGASTTAGNEKPSPWSAKQAVHHSFDSYGTELGLPGTIVTAAVQSNDGYVWVATPAGLARFDGIRFVSFSATGTNGLPGDTIHCLHQDRRGALWIGTENGLARHAQGRFSNVGLPGVPVRMIVEDAAGTVWIGTERGLYSCKADAPPTRFDRPGLPEDLRVRALLVDSGGEIWIAPERGRGVLRVAPAGTISRIDGGGALGEVLTICEVAPGSIWLGTKREGLFRFRGGELTQAEQGAGSPIYELRASRDGGLWMAAGVLKYAAAGDEPVFEGVAGVPNRNVQSVCEDREGGVWLCAGAEGLTRMRQLPYRLLSVRQGLPTDNIKNVTQDADGSLWLATQGSGVVRIDRSGVPQRQEGSVGEGDTAVVYAARDGSIWSGSSSQLWIRRDGTWTLHPQLRYVRGIYEDRRGTMWIGTESEGLWRIARGKAAEVKTTGGTRIHLATSFAETSDGALIVGTWRSGIWKIEPDGDAAADCLGGFAAEEVRAVHVDRKNRIWAGANRRGLIVQDNGQWLNPPSLNKALGGSVTAILEEGRGRLWLGTLAGVLWAEEEQLLRWMHDPVSAPPIHAMPVGEEIGKIPVWSGGQPVAWKSKEGDFLFATRRGILAIDPARVVLNTVPPPVHVEEVRVDQRAVDPAQGVRLPPGTRSLAFDYSAPSFVQPARVQFRYKLDGHDSDWIDAGPRRSASYGTLPAGDYVFRVSASNSDGVWNETGAQLAVIQLPYFYRTAWFGWLMAGLVAFFAWSLYRWSNRQLRLRLERLEYERAMENERRRIAQDLHDDLGASLTEIGLCAEAHRQTASPDEQPGLAYLSQRVRAIVASLDAIVWAVNPANDSLDHLVAYVGELFQELFRASGIRARLDVQSGIPALPLTAEERSDIFLTAKEAMNNILKHSGATEAQLQVRMKDRELTIVLTDNGRGFDLHAPAAAAGNGLTNMRTRIARARGRLELNSAPGAGTQMTLHIPFGDRPELRPARPAP